MTKTHTQMRLICHWSSACVAKNVVTWLKTVLKNQTSEPTTLPSPKKCVSRKFTPCVNFLLTRTSPPHSFWKLVFRCRKSWRLMRMTVIMSLYKKELWRRRIGSIIISFKEESWHLKITITKVTIHTFWSIKIMFILEVLLIQFRFQLDFSLKCRKRFNLARKRQMTLSKII